MSDILQKPPTVNGIPITLSISKQYIHNCASSTSRASFGNDLALVLETEKLPSTDITQQALAESIKRFPISTLWPREISVRLSTISDDDLRAKIYASTYARLADKLVGSDATTAFIAETGDWSASICWELLTAPHPDNYFPVPADNEVSPEHQSIEDEGRPYFARFLTGIDRGKESGLWPFLWANWQKSGHDDAELHYWKIAVLSRDPTRPRLEGTVTACIAPFIGALTRSEADEIIGKDSPDGTERIRARAVWLEAGNARARDLYLRFGFKIVREVEVGGTMTWMMMYTRD